VLADVEQALSDDIVFCPSPTPLPPSVAPTPIPEEGAESSEVAAAAPEAPAEETVRRASVSQDQTLPTVGEEEMQRQQTRMAPRRA